MSIYDDDFMIKKEQEEKSYTIRRIIIFCVNIPISATLIGLGIERVINDPGGEWEYAILLGTVGLVWFTFRLIRFIKKLKSKKPYRIDRETILIVKREIKQLDEDLEEINDRLNCGMMTQETYNEVKAEIIRKKKLLSERFHV